INALVEVETPFKTAPAVLSLYPVESRKSFRWGVGNGKFSALYTEIEIFFNSARCKYQHFKTSVCFVDVHSGSLRRTDEQVPVPASGIIAFCGTRLIVVHVFDFW